MKKLKTALKATFLLLGLALLTCCESSNHISKNSGTRSGKFDNGFHYYIKENHYDKSKAALRLVVKAGSSLETEDQKGLAHFVEHMVFRGTENFSDGEVIKYLESIGASFGADTNAYTSFDETVYHLDIPLDQEDSLDKALQILADFSSNALFDKEFVEKEKNVVLDELRLRQNTVSGRLTEKSFDFFLEGTRYAHRLPGGSKEIVKNCSRDDLLAFYHKWYRPENMAIIAVGDFNGSDVLSKIQTIYSRLKNENPKESHPEAFMPEREVNRTLVIKDAEAIHSSMHLGALIEFKPTLALDDLKEELMISMAISSLNKRFKKLTESDDSPFKSAYLSTAHFVRDFQCVNLAISPWEGKHHIALEEAMKEYYLFTKKGITEQELDERKASLKMTFSTVLENKDKQKNAAFVQEYITEFLDSSKVFSIEEEVNAQLEFLKTITVEDVNTILKEKQFDNLKWSFVFSAPENSTTLSENEFLSLLEPQSVEEMVSLPVKENKDFNVVVKELPGKVVSSEVMDVSKIEKLTLSNGMNVYLKHSDLKKNIMDIYLFAKGGFDSYDESIINSAVVATSFASRSGLNGLTASELNSALAGKNAQMNYQITLTERLLSGSCSNADSEEAFKLIYAILNHKYYRDASWHQILEMYAEILKAKDNNPEVRFQQDAIRLIHSNHYLFDDPVIEKMDQNQSKVVLNQAFSDPSEFTLVIVGDFDKEQIQKHIENYVAYETPKKTSLDPKVTSFTFPSGSVEKVIDGGIGNKSQSVLAFPLNLPGFKQKKEDYRVLNLAVKILNQRLRESIRMDSGETYNISASLFNPFFPRIDSAKVLISFSSDPKNQESVLEQVKGVLSTTHSKQVTDDELATVKEIYKQSVKSQEKSLSGLSSQIVMSLKLQENLNAPRNIDKELEEITKEKVEEAFVSLINFNNYVSISQKSRS